MRSAIYVVIALVAGCVSQPNTASDNAFAVDQAKMATIERRANQLGTRVLWVNPPRKSGQPTGS